MNYLTLDQVRKAGHYAEWVGTAAGMEAVVTYDPERQQDFQDRYFIITTEQRVEVTDYDTPNQMHCWEHWPPLDHWHHARGCGCEFCAE